MLVSRPDVDAFTIASLLRQLVELWELDTDELPGQILLPLLRSAVLARDGGAVIVDARETRAERSDDVAGYESADGRNLEAVLGRERFKGMTWWLTGLERCRAVARIENAYADAIGTGFLVDGKQLSPDLPDVVLVTNGHVVPEDLPYGQAFAVFHGLVGDKRVGPPEVRGHPMVVVPAVESAGPRHHHPRARRLSGATSRRCPWPSRCHASRPRRSPAPT